MSLRNALFTAVIALVCGFGGAAAWSLSGLGHGQTREYLLDHPELVVDMADRYRARQAEAKLASVAGQVHDPFPGAVLGNPRGTVVLTEFTDYGCTFCRLSRPEVAKLIADNPDLKVVIREWPIFQGSDAAARMALAAAKQGKFAAFHDAMFERAPPSPASIDAAAKAAGLDMAAAQAFIATDEANFELAKNGGLAERLGFSGTPSWVVGNRILQGAIGRDALQQAIDAAKRS